MAPAIELEDVGRAYGERTALAGVTLALEPGRTLAVFGANGAGKTTLLRILATLLKPHAGRARVLGRDLPEDGWAVRGRIGLLAHDPLLYRELSARENLRFHARLHGVDEARVEALLDQVGLLARGDEPVRTLSRGMAQRVAICRCALHEPELLLLDEPLANLDPGAAEAVAPLIGSERRAGARRHLPRRGARTGRGRRGARAAQGPRRDRRGARRRHRGRRAGAVRGVSTVAALVRKDLRLELRTRESVPSMFLFSLSTFVLFRFGLDRETLSGDLASGVLWVTLLFAAVLGMNRLFVAEREEGGFDAFLLAPVDRTALFVAKAAVLFGFLVAVEIAAIPAFAVLLLGPVAVAGAARSCCRCCCSPTSASRSIGTLVGALAIQTRARDLIVPLISLPLILPVVIAAGHATAPLFAEAGAEALPGRWLGVLGLYDLVFGLLALAVFDFLLED